MLILWTILLLGAAPLPTSADQLQKLLNFVNGDRVEAGVGGRGTAVAPPVPFAEVADPSRGVVPLDVPQPKGAQIPLPPSTRPVLRQQAAPAGLPGGAIQVAGKPLDQPQKARQKPTPLSEVEAPIFLSNTFPSPLNEINPLTAAAAEPAESMLHRLQAGGIPRPVLVTADGIPVLAVLGDQSSQARADAGSLNYASFGSMVFQEPDFNDVGSLQYDGQHVPRGPLHEGLKQADSVHALALQRHKQNVEKVKQLQREASHSQGHQPQPRHQQSQHHHISEQNRFSSQFQIPGRDQHRIYTEELKLAEEALKSLG